MVKDIKYIIKRILVSVGIFLVLSFLRGNLLISAHALTVDGQSIDPHVWSVDNTTYWVNASANNLWYNWEPGFVEFSFSITKMNQDSVSPLVTPKNVVLSTSSKDFTCNLGTTSANNSTYVTQVYSVSCPVSLENAGVTRVTINLMPLVTTPYQTYEIYFNGLLSYVDTSSSFTSNVNVDNSGVINSQNQNSQSIINNQNQNSQSIINNQNQNSQSIINNQNENTEKEIESQSVCKNLSIKDATLDGFLRSDGNFYSQVGYNKTTNFITLNGINKITLLKKATTNKYICFYDSSQVNINCIDTSTLSNNSDITIPSNASYFRVNFEVSNGLPVFSVCSNGNQSIVDSNNQLNDTLNDSTTDAPNNDVNSMNSKVASNNSITQLLTLPITLFQNVLNNINGSCSSYNLGSLYGSSLTLPCINLESILGSTLWGVIDVLISGLFILSFRKKMVDIFNHMSSLNDRGNELE